MSQGEQSRASQFFDRYAIDFDAIYGNKNRAFDRIINRLFRRVMVVRYEKTLAGCNPIKGCSAIDIGCGPGHYGVALAEAGAQRVVGLDFAPSMLKIAEKRAEAAGVREKCEFVLADFLDFPISEPFDYAIMMGFMDYIREPERVIERVAKVVRRRAFISFPCEGGLLAWQRKIRYRNRCDLFLYRADEIQRLMSRSGVPFSVERIGRDFFVTLEPRSTS